MIKPIITLRLFDDEEGRFNSALKSQRSAFDIQSDDDYPLVFNYLLRMATVSKFEASTIDLVLNELKEKDKQAAKANPKPKPKLKKGEDASEEQESKPPRSEVELLYAWGQFMAHANAALEKDGVVFGVGKAFEFLAKGASFLTTHIDKSSELPQKATMRDSFLNNLAKKMKADVTLHESDDARVFVSNCFGSGLPTSVTMSAGDQAALGIVCSSDSGMITSVGNAGDAPFQQFFMIKLMGASHGPINMFEILTEGRLDLIGKMLGLPGTPTVDDLRVWIAQRNGVQPFIAALFFGINCMVSGAHAAEVQQMQEMTGTKYRIRANSLLNTPEGRGINMIRLPVEDGYHLATPLINTGLLRDIHNLFWVEGMEDTREWRRMFTTISVGGSKPQNAGSFFTAIMSNGKIHALDAPLSSQSSGMRYLRKKLRDGNPLYALRKARALEICSREPSTDPAWTQRKLYERGRVALRLRVDALVNEVLSYLLALAGLVESKELSLTELSLHARNQAARAERDLIMGRVSDQALEAYAMHLQWQIFKKTHLTDAEKNVVASHLRVSLKKQIKEL